MGKQSLLWFRQDLRLTDNSALKAAAEYGKPVLAIFILDEINQRAIGGASRWWLHNSLKALAQDVENAGGKLHIFEGDSHILIPQICIENDIGDVFINRHYEPDAQVLESTLHKALAQSGVGIKRYAGQCLFEPDAVLKGDGSPYKVFTPFYKACLRLPEPSRTPLAPLFPDWAERKPTQSLDLDDLKLLPSRPDWSSGLQENWQPGENGAAENLDIFLDSAVANYGEHRDIPAEPGTSRVSPHLHFGEISPRQIWYRVQQELDQAPEKSEGATAYLREIIWRDFAHYLLHHWPSLPSTPFRAEFKTFPWRSEPDMLKAWQTGQTGYPLVDAGMRQLWQTGWMHNRVRMVVASFLVKHLMQHWQEGERWFWDTLVDANMANNVASWQWVAGCGADAAPYFRVFNPTLQSEKFDAMGDYVREFVPELSALPKKYIHAPHTAPAEVLSAAGVELGKHYPRPIVDHKFARERALAAHKSFTKG